MLHDKMWSDDETATTAALTAEPMEDECKSDEEDEMTEIEDENRYGDPPSTALYNREGRSESRSIRKWNRRDDDEMSSGERHGQQRKPSQAEVKPSQQEAKSLQKEATSSQKVHAKNLDVRKLATERYLDV